MPALVVLRDLQDSQLKREAVRVSEGKLEENGGIKKIGNC